jgi:predicted membrane-bound mannosyltransferase
MLNLIDRWFESVSASQDYKRDHFIVLALLIIAGAALRFWHLDNVGLHGDEDIMGLAARGIIEHGIPVLPSEMVYWRAPLYTYLLAGSTAVFGDTEWALRFPSAVVGSLCGLLAFYVGRRFLDPIANLGFVATVIFLPVMIEVSQTARMYVFLIACLLLFAVLLFRWERDRSVWAACLGSCDPVSQAGDFRGTDASVPGIGKQIMAAVPGCRRRHRGCSRVLRMDRRFCKSRLPGWRRAPGS